jgi:hypothetical protein
MSHGSLKSTVLWALPNYAAIGVLSALALLAPLSAASQDIHRDSAAVTINPSEATIHVGQKQIFKAIIKSTQSAGIQWAVQEPDGGRITQHGIYTAPRQVGRYHVVATSERDPSAKAVATVTVVTESDAPGSRKQKF